MATVEIDVDDYLDEASTSYLLEELKKRMKREKANKSNFRQLLLIVEYDIEPKELIDLYIEEKQYTIYDAQNLKNTIQDIESGHCT